MQFDPVLLSRIQFAWVIGWHILLPAFTVGAASFIAVVEGLSLATRREVYVRISTFWTKLFAIAFGMGVVTGVIMPFQIGTNWSRYASAGANILSPLFAYEGLTAFFLEVPQRTVELTFSADRDQLFTAWKALANLADLAGKINVTVRASSDGGFDRNKLENGVLEPLRETNLIE
ncbi:MAG TPA: cytochrome ubiquinol oxidase subunit I [Stellaceae bacterium]|nr:cytochrome ubiquinol oxidase subunit I [Stellaceae bacterium]